MALELTIKYQEIINSGKPVVIWFLGRMGGPCRMVGHCEELAKGIRWTDLVVGKWMSTKMWKLLMNNICKYPTILFFKDGQVVDKQIGR